MDEISKLCKHPKLAAKWWVAQGRAIVSCIACQFTVEIIGDNLDESILRTEFNQAAQKALIGQRTFSVTN